MNTKRGIVLIVVLGFTLVLVIAIVSFMFVSLSEINMVRRQNNSTKAFYLAEAGIERARARLNQDWDDRSSLSNIPLGDGTYNVGIGDEYSDNGKTLRPVRSTGDVDGVSRTVEVVVGRGFPWTNPPAAVYANGSIKEIKFDKRDDAYIAGGNLPGIYATGDVKTKKKGEGRITGTPAILENQGVPGGLEDGLYEAFDLNKLRQIAINEGTYFQGDEYNKKGKYTLPVVEGETEGVFFFDTKDGGVLDDDQIDKKNEANVELKGTTEQMSGIIVVLGDLKIVDTKDYDFLFDGIIIVLDDLKIDDKRHGRRHGSNDSDIFIRGAILTDDIITKGKRRKKKATIDIKNATIEYDKEKVEDAPPFPNIYLDSWQEI